MQETCWPKTHTRATGYYGALRITFSKTRRSTTPHTTPAARPAVPLPLPPVVLHLPITLLTAWAGKKLIGEEEGELLSYKHISSVDVRHRVKKIAVLKKISFVIKNSPKQIGCSPHNVKAQPEWHSIPSLKIPLLSPWAGEWLIGGGGS